MLNKQIGLKTETYKDIGALYQKGDSCGKERITDQHTDDAKAHMTWNKAGDNA